MTVIPIKNVQQPRKDTLRLYDRLFSVALKNNLGRIELRYFINGIPHQEFFDNTSAAAIRAVQLSQAGHQVYFGVNPRLGGGKKENILYVTVIHVDVDYGPVNHKKKTKHVTKQDALTAIQNFQIPPSFIIDSGNGFHCYWVLNAPVDVSKIGVEVIEGINKEFCKQLGGDLGTHDISRVLRPVGTDNLKDPANPKPVRFIVDDGPDYDFDDLRQLLPDEPAPKPSLDNDIVYPDKNDKQQVLRDIDDLPVSNKIKEFILNGNNGGYSSRSERDMAVVVPLLNSGVSEREIRHIFNNYPIGGKYREQKYPDRYLEHTIKSAKSKLDLSESELQDPLFTSGSIVKDGDKTHLDIVNFQELISQDECIRSVVDEDILYRFTGTHYEILSRDKLNSTCQEALGYHRRLFKRRDLDDFGHYVKGDKNSRIHVKAADANYLTLQNGLFDINNHELIEHDPGIFTTNILPYEYDPSATCPRYMQFLDEVFESDAEKIKFVQEAVGYSFHRSIPIAAIFLLIGKGCNGKSVFLDILTELFGLENTANINLGQLAHEYYIKELMGKMINISTESPNRKIDTEQMKAATSGDLITGREPFEKPVTFRPFAKHYLAMNQLPYFDDKSHGMDRRIYVIEFPRKFERKETDAYLTDKLKKELPGIFNWALEGYIRLKSKGFKFDFSESLVRRKQEILYEGDSVKSFADECFTKTGNEDDYVKYKDAYDQYSEYCQKNNVEKQKKKDFRAMLENLGFDISPSTKQGNKTVIHETKSNLIYS